VNGYFTALSALPAFSDDNETTKLYNNLYNGIPVDYIEVFTNNNRQKNFGGSFQINSKHRIGDLHLNTYFALSYVTGRVEDGLNEQVETSQDTETDFIAPFMTRIGADLKVGKFSVSPRLILMGRQNISGISDTTGWLARRQTLPGYVLLNISARYAVNKQLSGFVNVVNALDQRYKAVGFHMDLSNTNTDTFQGVRQDPIRIRAGFNWEL
jgi:outer membrane receptor protein involved in Fe transport